MFNFTLFPYGNILIKMIRITELITGYILHVQFLEQESYNASESLQGDFSQFLVILNYM